MAKRRLAFVFRGRWLWATISVALLCALFITLGSWQLQRLGQKRATDALIPAAPPSAAGDAFGTGTRHHPG
jgi:cytochrome oxidase assembly protein ShyY1